MIPTLWYRVEVKRVKEAGREPGEGWTQKLNKKFQEGSDELYWIMHCIALRKEYENKQVTIRFSIKVIDNLSESCIWSSNVALTWLYQGGE